MSPHVYKHHPWTHDRKKTQAVRVADQAPAGFNGHVALRLTALVGTMPAAYSFAALALLALPGILGFTLFPSRTLLIVAWISQTFIQLVMLAVLQLGQNLQAAGADKRAEATYLDAESVLHEVMLTQDHLIAQDELIRGTQTAILAAIATGQAGLGPALKAHIGGVLAAHQETLVSSLVNAMPPAEPPQKGKR